MRKPRNLRRWILWGIVLLIVVLPFTGCISLDRAVVYHPWPYPNGDWKRGEEFEDAWFHAPDGTRLHGWFAEVKNPVAVVLHTHGNAGNVTNRGYLLRQFRDRFRCSILVFDYRGYGRSEGKPTEAGLLADSRAARAWLARRTGVPESAIVLHGASLGGGVAVDLAAADGTRGLILENTFTSIPDVASHHAPFLPVRSLLRTRLDSLSKIARYRGPLLQMHGDADRTIPFRLGERLFDAANEPKEFLRIKGADHNDPDSEEYLQAVKRFLEALPGSPRPLSGHATEPLDNGGRLTRAFLSVVRGRGGMESRNVLWEREAVSLVQVIPLWEGGEVG